MTAVVEDELPRGVCAPQTQERQVEITRAIILAGGLGMRLRPYTMVRPKPLIPIGDRPILEHIIRQLGAVGVRRVELCLGRHLGTLIQTYFSQAMLPDDIEVAIHWEEAPLGTAGALRNIPDLDAPFIAMNGDILTTVDFQALLATHVEERAALTIAMQRERVEVGLRVIECSNGRITGYHRTAEPTPGGRGAKRHADHPRPGRAARARRRHVGQRAMSWHVHHGDAPAHRRRHVGQRAMSWHVHHGDALAHLAQLPGPGSAQHGLRSAVGDDVAELALAGLRIDRHGQHAGGQRADDGDTRLQHRSAPHGHAPRVRHARRDGARRGA